jgi:hypothetical protein
VVLLSVLFFSLPVLGQADKSELSEDIPWSGLRLGVDQTIGVGTQVAPVTPQISAAGLHRQLGIFISR